MPTTNTILTKGASKSKMGLAIDALINRLDAAVVGGKVVTPSATPTFDASLNVPHHQITMAANITSSTIANPQKIGQIITLKFIQGSTGNFTVVFPANSSGGVAPALAVGKTTVQDFKWSGTTWIAVDAGGNF